MSKPQTSHYKKNLLPKVKLLLVQSHSKRERMRFIGQMNNSQEVIIMTVMFMKRMPFEVVRSIAKPQ